ncbi:MAG: tRNA uridine-5-carboxymethylaminomethyl(34) synthesis enzyme MnmG [Phycisphaerae bacterium]|nr:tRNA uridine-5-carboxymethylaminomethyl(34) synthesis enzyme MnmG [Phycisphaerae bacterium]
MSQGTPEFDVIVVGGGHAGAEAAWAAANMGARCALVTVDPARIGVMSCNPAIGGLAKGQIVREIDALGGLMARATDATGIMFKTLNTSKGPAVRGPRAQCDKHAYAREVRRLLQSRAEITILPGFVESFVTRPGGTSPSRRIVGVVIRHLDASTELRAGAVVLTTGTFMRGLMHTGESRSPGGRIGEPAAVTISSHLRELGFELGRLKTGTPPRLRRSTIDWDSLEPQTGDEPPEPFSDLTWSRLSPPSDSSARAPFPLLPQVDCRITSTNAAIHAAIRANLHRAPMYSGQIESVGPRYCPSIEDKVVRFAQRESHHVFLEPESHESDWIYCNGISTSLPKDVQEAIVRAMPGCQRAEILQFGYAVEYDMVRPHQIHATAMTKIVDGLFLAGQINGTSGYEEAAGQGLLAGINAVRFARGVEPMTLGRDESYIGVMMDDLVTKTPIEPYRMFTSRAEHRLLLRADNAADRLTPRGRELGTVCDERWSLFQRRRTEIDAINRIIDAARIDNESLALRMKRPGYSTDDLRRDLESSQPAAPPRSMLPQSLFTVLAERQYDGYITRQRAEVRRHAETEHRRLPREIDYRSIIGLRAEARESLARFRPETFGQASRLEGVNPTDLTLLLVAVSRNRARR